MSPQEQPFRRRADGSIDVEFYRRRAVVERTQARRQVFRGMAKWVRPLCAVAALAVAFAMLFGGGQNAASPDALVMSRPHPAQPINAPR